MSVAPLDDAISLFLIDASTMKRSWLTISATRVSIAETEMVELLDDSLKHAYSQHELSSIHTVSEFGKCMLCMSVLHVLHYMYL